VEGASDVYAVQAMLLRYLLDKGESFDKFNRIGIYHFNGDNFKHLLYTIPKNYLNLQYFSTKTKKKKLERSLKKLTK